MVSASTSNLDEPPAVDMDVVSARVERALKSFQKDKCGVNVTRDGIELFRFLNKTHPEVQFRGSKIQCLGCVISEPFRESNVKAEDCDMATESRIKKVVASFWVEQNSNRTKSKQVELDPRSFQSTASAASPFISPPQVPAGFPKMST